MNIVVDDNESGKSTLLEAISLALTGKINGNWAREELNPYWFHQGRVKKFFEDLRAEEAAPPPEILIEIYLGEDDEPQRMRGVHNSMGAGDLLVICDAGFSVPKNAELIDVSVTKGMPSFIDVLSVIFSHCIVEETYIAKDVNAHRK